MNKIDSIPVVYNKATLPPNRKEFAEYHKANPEIYSLFCDLTFEMINAGRERYSSYLTLGRIKWDIDKRYFDADFAIPTTVSPYYPRKFMADYPEHSGFYETRTLKDDAEGDEFIKWLQLL